MTAPDLPRPSDLAPHWRLDPGIVHLNHGSFGACPTEVLDAQRRHAERVERDAVTFYVDDASAALDRSRDAIAPILGCPSRDVVFVPNATHGVAAALHNLDLKQGDEILANTHEYPACLNMLRDICARTGATLVTPELPWPAPSADTLAAAVLERVTPRTRACLLSAVTSPTALIMPISKICRELHARNVDVILDAAHAAGFFPMDLAGWGVAFAAGNAHKWLCAPKGAAWLYVREDRQPGFRPQVLSNHAEEAPSFAAAHDRSAFHVEFDYVGTRDVTEALSIPDAVAFLERCAGSMDAYAERNRALALRGRDVICARLGVQPSAPDDLLGAMATIDLPPRPASAPAPASIWLDPLKDALFRRHRVQVPVWAPRSGVDRGGARAVRISANLYNSIEQYDYLADSLATELARERA